MSFLMRSPGSKVLGAVLGLTLALVATAAVQEQSQEPPAKGFTETVEVRLAEVYVAVTDSSGRPAAGLGLEDFSLEQGGIAQRLERAVDARDLPIALGLAIDTSASMFAKLPAVTGAARALLDQLVSGRDRGFLVSFGGEPALVEPHTLDLGSLRSSLQDLETVGRTPLWAGIERGLEELERVAGQRALVVFSDGADEDGNRAYAQCVERARRVKAPIYVVVMNNEAARSEGRDFQTRRFISRLERVAGAGGGQLYFSSTRGDLSAVYTRIQDQLRSAYLLTYYPSPGLDAPSAADLQVKVRGRGLKARPVSAATAVK